MQPYLTLSIERSPAPVNNKIGKPVSTGRTAMLVIDQSSEQPLKRGQRMGYAYMAVTLDFAIPDIEEGDRLVDPSEIDARTGQPALYIVLGKRTWQPSHLQLKLWRQVGA